MSAVPPLCPWRGHDNTHETKLLLAQPVFLLCRNPKHLVFASLTLMMADHRFTANTKQITTIIVICGFNTIMK